MAHRDVPPSDGDGPTIDDVLTEKRRRLGTALHQLARELAKARQRNRQLERELEHLTQHRPRNEETAMKFLFEDDAFSFETLRTAGFAAYGGADLGEVIATASHIGEGDEASWHGAWKATAQRVAEIGEQALASGHHVSAREALLRASNYYRTAADFLLEAPASDPEMALLSAGQSDTFAAAAALLDTPVEAVSIPYEDTALPAYLFLVDDSGAARPTIIYNSGYDSTREESYFAIAAAALRRGYNVLAFDGPGQGAALREQKLVMRPDWEAVITPVVDYALTRTEIANHNVALFGYSLGGYLVARAAAFERRVAALILDDGIHDFHAAFAGNLPPFMESWIEEGRDDVSVPVLTMLTAVSTNVRWGLRNGMWVFGTDSYADLIRTVKDYTLDGIAHQIEAPTLILNPENDHNLNGQPELVEKALTGAPTTLVTLTEEEGAGEHTHAGGLGRAHQTMFDWLDATLAA